jgi:uncharacterized repeat protein (TIGR01451 family)
MTGLVIIYAACRTWKNLRHWRFWCMLWIAASAGYCSAQEGVVRLKKTAPASPIERMAYSAEASGVQPTSGEFCPPVTYDPCPRVGGPCGPGCPNCGPGGACPVIIGGPGVVAWDPTHYPDEYLCDGGDRAAPFHYEGRELGGLDTEDTIAEGFDVTGERLVVPSSHVCVYAPRFGALRTISGTHLTRDAMRAAGAHERRRVAGVNTHLNIDEQVQQDRLQQMDMRSRASSADANARESGLQQGVVAQLGQQQLAVFQNITFLSEGQFLQSDLPILAYGAQNAGVWTRDENPVIVGHDVNGHELESEFRISEVIGTGVKGPPLLRIIKLADRETAKPGDVIKFTLRFDNLGQREILDLKVIDNLTPRLEYVAGSATCELAGGLDIEPNKEGSSILTFRLDDPLQGKSGGVITFECRVR